MFYTPKCIAQYPHAQGCITLSYRLTFSSRGDACLRFSVCVITSIFFSVSLLHSRLLTDNILPPDTFCFRCRGWIWWDGDWKCTTCRGICHSSTAWDVFARDTFVNNSLLIHPFLSLLFSFSFISAWLLRAVWPAGRTSTTRKPCALLLTLISSVITSLPSTNICPTVLLLRICPRERACKALLLWKNKNMYIQYQQPYHHSGRCTRPGMLCQCTYLFESGLMLDGNLMMQWQRFGMQQCYNLWCDEKENDHKVVQWQELKGSDGWER